MPTNRNIYETFPLIGKMSQGSIINGCIAESFPNEEVFGLIITPRCDLGHEGKVTTVHYLPVVPFERWFDVIARPILKTVWKKEIKNTLNNLFKKAKIGNDVMSADFEYNDLIQICNTKIKKQETKDEIFLKLNAYFDKESDCFEYFLLDGEGKDKSKHKLIDYIARLESNGIAAYYAIEGWEEYGDKHLIVMLRDVRRIQFNVAMKIKNGVTVSELCSADKLHNDLFLSDNQNFFWVQSQIASPFIEHIMQAFVYNFSRIGVEDRPGDTIEKMFHAIKSTIA